MVAVDQEYAPDDTDITEGSEVAFIPPYPAVNLTALLPRICTASEQGRTSGLHNPQATISTLTPLNIAAFVAML
ncbi:MoaD/ThiS family protein [Paenibacillus rhizoplanae]